MNSNQLANAAAIAFAAFAAWYVLRQRPVVGTVQAAQVQRDLGLQSWLTNLDRQAAETQQAKGVYDPFNSYRFGMVEGSGD